MKLDEKLASHLQSAERGVVYLLVFFLPLFFLPFTLDTLEMPKQTLLVFFVSAAALLWIGSVLLSGKIFFRKHWMNILPFFFLMAFGLSAWFSESPYLSWIGLMGQEYNSFLTITSSIILFYLISQTIFERTNQRLLVWTLLASSLFTVMIGVLGLTTGLFGNTIGSWNTFAIYAIVMTIFTILLGILDQDSKQFIVCSVLLSIVTFFLLLILDYWTLWMLFFFGFGCLFFTVFVRSKWFPSIKSLIFPIVLCVLAIPFWLWLTSPFSIRAPIEVSPNFSTSMVIAQKSFENFSPWFGSGEGTYPFQYSIFRGVEINQTNFWNVRFDRGFSYFLTLVPTVGLVGISVITFFCLTILFSFFGSFKKHRVYDQKNVLMFFVPWLVLVIASELYSFNMTLIVYFFVFSALVVSMYLPKPKEFSLFKKQWTRFLGFGLLMSGIFFFFVGLFFATERALADSAFAKADRLDRAQAPLVQVVQELDRAVTLNRWHDGYIRALAEALLLRVDEEVQKVSGDTMTPESRDYIQALIGASVNAAIRATELSPRDANNWLMRGLVYRILMDVLPESETFALLAHERMIELEPFHPRYLTEYGKTLMAAAIQQEKMTSAENETESALAFEHMNAYLKQAEQAFQRSIELKQTYAPAHFQLALVYEKQDRLDEAIEKMEQVIVYNPTDAGALFELGLFYFKRNEAGDIDRAKQSLQKALMLLPNYANARWLLASVYEKQGDLSNALRELEQMLAFDPLNQLLKNRIDQLSKGQGSNSAEFLPE